MDRAEVNTSVCQFGDTKLKRGIERRQIGTVFRK